MVIRKVVIRFRQETLKCVHLCIPTDPLVSNPLVAIEYRTTHVMHPKQKVRILSADVIPHLESVLPSILLSFQYKRLPDSGLKNSPSFGNIVKPPDETSER